MITQPEPALLGLAHHAMLADLSGPPTNFSPFFPAHPEKRESPFFD
jgi:hypothetical protein